MTVGPVQAVGALMAEVAAFAEAGGQAGGRSVVVRALDEPVVCAEVGAERVRPAGSLVKMVSAVALYAAAGRGELDLDTGVAVGELGRTAYPSVLRALDAGRVLSVREVCAFSLVTSDNPAAQFVRVLLGQDRIDATIAELGLDHTVFPVGFTDADLGARGRANLTSAGDMLRLITYIETMPALADLRRFLVNNQRNHRIPVRLDDDIPVLHKTGTLAGVVNDVGVVHHPAGRVGLAFLCDGEKDTALAGVAIGDATERILRIVAGARPPPVPSRAPHHPWEGTGPTA